MATVKKTINETHFVHKQDVGANDKCPPQAIVILNAIKDAENQRIERSALVSLLSDGRLTTRQTPERILGFYKPKLIAAGFIAEEKVPVEIEVEVPDKPEKPAKAAVEPDQKAEGAAPASVKSKKGNKVVQTAATAVEAEPETASAEASA